MKNLRGLMVEVLTEDELWNELFRIIGEYDEEAVRPYINQMRMIRAIDNKTDSEIVDESIGQLGIDIHQDILNANKKSIHRGFYALSQFYKINGMKLYPRFIEFLLGRGFRVTTLYTSDYENFYPTPLGETVEDGGTWYATSHVNLEVYDGSDVPEIGLNIGEGDIEYIKRANDYNNMTRLEREAFDAKLDESLKKTLNFKFDDPDIVRPLFRKRISDMFYRFAPIQMVIKDIFMTKYAAASLNVCMSAISKGRHYIPHVGVPVDIEIAIPAKVSSNEELGPLLGVVEWSTGGYSTVELDDISDSKGLLADNKNIRFNDPNAGLYEITSVTGSYQGFIASKDVTVYLSGTTINPDSIKISMSAALASNSRSRILLLGTFGDNVREIEDKSSVEWTLASDKDITGLVSIEDGFLSIGEVLFDTDVTVSALYTLSDGSTMSAQSSVRLYPVLTGVVAARIEPVVYEIDDDGNLTETSSVVQGRMYAAKAFVLHTDNSYAETSDAVIESLTGIIELDENNTFLATPTMDTYPFVLRATLETEDRVTSNSVRLNAQAVIVSLESISIQGAAIMGENSRQSLMAIGQWSNGARTILADVVWESVESADIDGTLSRIDVDRDGNVRSPTVDKDQRYLVRASKRRLHDNMLVESNFIITVLETVRAIDSIAIYMADSIREGVTSVLNFIAVWNNGTNTQIIPDVINIVNRDGGEIVAAASLENGEMMYASNGSLVLQNSDKIIHEANKDLDLYLIELVHVAGEVKTGGVFDLKLEYEYMGATIEASRSFVSIPYIPQIIKIEHNLPATMSENSRYLGSVTATYEDGNRREVSTGWTVYDVNGSTAEEDLPIDIVVTELPLEDIVAITINYDRESITDMAVAGENLSDYEVNRLLDAEPFFRALENRPSAVQTWPQKLGILYAQYDGTLFPRTVISTRPVEADEDFTLDCAIGGFELRTEHTIVNAPLEPHNKILSWYIKGPVEVEADENLMYSYSLIVDFDDGGEAYAVSNDWDIRYASIEDQRTAIRYLVETEGRVELLPMSTDGTGRRKTVDELDEEEMEDILPITDVIDIDQNGYIYPKLNVAIHAIVEATYNDGRVTFVSTLDIYSKQVNKILTGLSMYLKAPNGDLTSDFGDKITDSPSMWGTPYNNSFMYQLTTLLSRTDETEAVAPTGVVIWRAEPVDTGVSFDQSTGRLYVSEQADDSNVMLIAEYSEEIRETEESDLVISESVTARYNIGIYAHKAIDVIELTGPSYAQDNRNFSPVARIKRRTGVIADVNLLSWEIVEADPSIVQLDSKTFRIPPQTVDSTMTLRAVATEGVRTISKEFAFNVLAGFVPQTLKVDVNPTGHKDNSTLQLIALLYLRNNAVPISVASSCYWSIDTDNNFAQINSTTGLLTLGYCARDTTLKIRCVYAKDSFRLEETFNILVQSSYPRYWTDKTTPINAAYLNSILDGQNVVVPYIVPSVEGGRFVLVTHSDEYIYFACPAEIGNAKFSLVPSKVDIDDWGNMNDPVTVVRTYQDSFGQDWNVYRSKVRGLGHIELSVVYSR